MPYFKAVQLSTRAYYMCKMVSLHVRAGPSARQERESKLIRMSLHRAALRRVIVLLRFAHIYIRPKERRQQTQTEKSERRCCRSSLNLLLVK